MNNLFLLEKLDEIDLKENSIPKDSDVIAFDYDTHKILSTFHIKHTSIDDYISEKDRKEFFHSVSSFWNWYETFHDKDFFFHQINLLSIIDRNEIHEFLMTLIPKIKVVKNLLTKSNYSKIYSSHEISKLIESFSTYDVLIFGKNKSSSSLTYDKITLSYGKIPFSIMPKINRKKFLKLKGIYENTVSSIFKLNQKLPEQKKIILIEFNPEVYKPLLYEMSRNNIQPVLLNFRRPATWSLNSINILRKTNSLVISPEDILGKQKLSEIKNQVEIIFNKIKKSFSNNHNVLSTIFIYEDVKFYPILIELFIKIFRERLEEYMIQILISKELDHMSNILCGITLNFSGETEKTFSQIIKTFPILLLQHAFSNYPQPLIFLDVLDDFKFYKNKIIVYGDIIHNYLSNTHSIPEKDILVCGSPKYDSLKPTIKKIQSNKKILITLRPIISHVEGLRINLYDLYEKTLISIISTCKNFSNVELVFKLHPQQNPNNDFLREIIKKNCSDAKIIQFDSITNLFNDCDLHINIAPDNFDISSVVLEAMILKRPTLNIQLQSNEFNFDIIDENAIRSIMHDDEIEKEINQLLYNEKKINELLSNSEKYLKKSLSNPGIASKILITNLLTNNS